MAKYLTPEWIHLSKQLAAELPERIGATGRVQSVITGGPEGDVELFQVVENGRIVDVQLGRDPAADFTMTMSYPDSAKIQRGEREAGDAYRKGDLTVDGDLNKLFALLPLIGSFPYRELQQKIAAQTEF